MRWAAAAQASLRAFLEGAQLDVTGTPVAGFSKTVFGVYTGPYTISELHLRYLYGLSEQHLDSDVWLDLWFAADTAATGQHYVVVEATPAGLQGTKCLAGYCRAAPVWMLVR